MQKIKILDGKKLSEKILNNLKKEIKNRRLKLKLAVVLVGEDPSSKIFIRKKKEAAERIGADFRSYRFKKEITQKQLEGEIKIIIKDPENSGVVVQLPLPEGKDSQKILDIIPNRKDVDVLSSKNFDKFSRGESDVLPPTVGAIAGILHKYGINLKGKYVVIVGAGRLVGKPLAAWLRIKKANFSILDKSTEDLSFFTKKADILISGVGKPDLIKGNMVKVGASVIDFGNHRKKGRIVGDVNFNSVSKKAGYITPVSGGVGPMTVACLLDNLVRLNS